MIDTSADLLALFSEINRAHFLDKLPVPLLTWNSRLRTSAGRFRPGSRWNPLHKPQIEIASYLQTEVNGALHIRNTLAHEMIHYWLWVRKRPYGHTDEFKIKMAEFGDIRYNPVPKLRPYKYIYECPSCQKEINTRKRLGNVACRSCCQEFSRGKYHPQFKLSLKPCGFQIEKSKTLSNKNLPSS